MGDMELFQVTIHMDVNYEMTLRSFFSESFFFLTLQPPLYHMKNV